MINRPWIIAPTLAVALATFLGPARGDDTKAPRRPNIVLVLADDLGWRDTTPYGSTFYETPNIDRLARRGVRFTDAHAANPLCSPTRASILTGQYPCRLGITVPNGHIREEVLQPSLPARAQPNHKATTPTSRNRLPLECVTLAERLRDAGYATGHFGKWHLGWEPFDPKAQGFDVAIPGGSFPGPPGTYFSPFKAAIYTDAPAGRHIDELTSEAAAAWIKENKDRPFFLNYWLFSVHAPYDGGRPELVEKYREKAAKAPDNPQRNPVMGAMVQMMDEAVGRVLDAIDAAGVADNTIILFTGDNGGVSWQEVEGAPVTSNLPLRNGKASLYEGGTREPLLVAWPGHARGGTTSDALVSSIDFAPTLLQMAGLDPAPPAGQPLDGTSFAPVLDGSGTFARDTLFCHFPHYVPASANLPGTWARRGDWKLIRFHADGPGQADRFELYNLRDDLGETTNREADHPEIVRELNAAIDRHLKETGALVPSPNPAFNPNAPPPPASKKEAEAAKKKAPGGARKKAAAQKKQGATVRPASFQGQATKAKTQAGKLDISLAPGVVIDHSPASSRQYIGSVSLAFGRDGALVASHDLFGPGSTRSKTRVFASTDRGATWTQQGEIEGQWWSTLFAHRDALYLMGTSREYGATVIRRSTDNGATWTEPRDARSGLLHGDGKYHCAPVPVVEHDGRLWRAMEDAQGPGGWGSHFRAFMMSAPVDADLLDAVSWTSSNRLGRDPAWLDGRFRGWLEGNAVVGPDGRMLDVLRVDLPAGSEELAAFVHISDDGTTATFDPAADFIPFPGGAKKFVIRYDPRSKLYWALTNAIPEPDPKRAPASMRNSLALASSPDLRDWTIRKVLVRHPDPIHHGYQYPDWQFDGDDLIAVVRTAHDDGLGGAHNAHDANWMTFHRVADFRALAR
jgi:arylsulfatase A-like enzyme